MHRGLPIYENVTIADVAAEGKAVCRVGDMVVFVPWAVPGDVVDLQVTRRKHSYSEARILRMITPSPWRRTPQCEHFGVCGGCRWQNLPYQRQLEAKQKQVFDQLTRIGKVALPEFRTILGSEREYEYRNKLEFGFSNRRWLTQEEIEEGETVASRDALGFHIGGAWDKILPIDTCHLMDPLHNVIRNAIRDYAVEHQLAFYDIRNNTGLLRDVVLRCTLKGEWMVIFQLRMENDGNEKEAKALMRYIMEMFPEVSSLMYVDNHKCNDSYTDQEVKLFAGRDYIMEEMGDLHFKVGPKSFYQTNTLQAKRLYEVVRDFAALTGEELVYDLYTGTGTIANFVARCCKKVIGIEYVSEAIEDAKVNSEVNGIDNTEFVSGDMKDILTEDFVMTHGSPDVVITDPPRAGMHEDVVKVLLKTRPRRIVYVSCNPATQARDLSLMDADYRVEEVQPVDMFPHTPHVENVVLMIRR